jgi:hypothetical protein
MDQIIRYELVVEFFKNPPMLSALQDFTKLRALQKHVARALKQLVCPQSAIHGWSGLVLLPTVYALLEPTPFLAPVYPGDVVLYPQFALPAQIKTANAMFTRLQNKWKSYKNIQQVCFFMLDKNVADQFKVSNVPTLTGWNTSMSIRAMLDQLKGTCGKPDTMTLFAKDMLFQSPFSPVDAHEALYRSRRYKSKHVTHIWTCRLSTMLYVF